MSDDHSNNVLLITRDPELRDLIARHRPATARLRCVAPDELLDDSPLGATQFWVDLDSAPGPPARSPDRRVYFYSSSRRPPQALPPGLYIRKPCSPAVLDVLWAEATLGQTAPDDDPRGHHPPAQAGLPIWLLDFHELSLSELCQRVVSHLPGRLGYTHASLYLHDPQPRVLSLAECNHDRHIDLAVRTGKPHDHLMVAVAHSGQPLITRDVAQAYRTLGVRRPAHARHYLDEACLVAPLISAGELQGVLNLCHRCPTGQVAAPWPWTEFLAFLARSLQHARCYERARTEARVDSLTGLFNHRWIVETLEKEIHRAQRFDTPLALIVIDLDELKSVNDRLGHLAGDAVLRHVAQRIITALRQIDSAARMGGDEFVVVLPTTDLRGARNVAQRVLTAIRDDAPIFHDSPLPVTASLGVAQWQSDWNAEQLLEAADRLMYVAKRQGRNCLACRAYTPSPRAHHPAPALPANPLSK